nr:PREDICTED: uncharacterized protein LOC106521841 [Austrofundulus limnaeus]
MNPESFELASTLCTELREQVQQFLLLLLLVLSSASLNEAMKNHSEGNVPPLTPDLKDGFAVISNETIATAHRILPPAESRNKRHANVYRPALKWHKWNGHLPDGAVSIYNDYTKRIDYVCTYACQSGFYTSSKGPYCHYPFAGEERTASSFEILVNENGFEKLEWKEGSHGSVPAHSLYTCSSTESLFVGKNKYGLGKVHPSHDCFYLPWEGKEYWYMWTYEVLTINMDASDEVISDVKYNTIEARKFKNPPEVLKTSTTSNANCQSVSKTIVLSAKTSDTSMWDVNFDHLLNAKQLLLLLLVLSSASLHEAVKNHALKEKVPPLTPDLKDEFADTISNVTISTVHRILPSAESRNKRQVNPYASVFDPNSKLRWEEWNGRLPNGAVSIYNDYTERIDYVCKYDCHSGFYTSSKGPYCLYTDAGKERTASSFYILVNEDGFEKLEWKQGSYGSVPEHSVSSCSTNTMYVGKNKYGLGTVYPKDKSFYLPWEGLEYSYQKTYEALTTNMYVRHEFVTDVKYNIDQAEILKNPPKVLKKSTISNANCQPVTKTTSLTTKTSETIPPLTPDVKDGVADRISKVTISTVRLVLPHAESGHERQVSSYASVFDPNSKLTWKTWNNELPNGVVSIYNDYTKRTDYVCKYGCHSGFYSPEKGPNCHYSAADKELLASSFEILVNEDNFEMLEWKGGSYGSVPENAVSSCFDNSVYVGKNKYGLGKVSPQNKCFFLPYEGKEYWYKHYEVLTTSMDVISEDISDVEYNTDHIEKIKNPPNVMKTLTFKNADCQPGTQTTTFATKNGDTKTWNFNFSLMLGAKGTFKTGIPVFGEGTVEVSSSVTLQYSQSSSVTVEDTHTVSFTHVVPPKSTCIVKLVGLTYNAKVPFTARLTRTYRSKKTSWTTITGTFSGVQLGELVLEEEPCEPLPNTKPCA